MKINLCEVGKFYNEWQVLDVPPVSRTRNRQLHYMCMCRCGRTTKYVSARDLIYNTNKRCQVCKAENQYRGYKDLSQTLWFVIKKGARHRNLEFKITIKEAYDLLESQDFKCALSGTPIALIKNYSVRREDQTASLDRIDSNKGYIMENLRWIHKDINIMKNNYTDEEYLNFCRLVADHHKK